MVAQLTLGRCLLTFIGVSLGPGPFIADYNETHVFNPNWTPHAKFHNGQTMSMGVCLSMAILYYTWRRDPETDDGDSIKVATVFASLYWVSGIAAWFFPGALAVDPEFGEGFPQLYIFGPALLTSWLACWLESSRLSTLKGVSSVHRKSG